MIKNIGLIVVSRIAELINGVLFGQAVQFVWMKTKLSFDFLLNTCLDLNFNEKGSFKGWVSFVCILNNNKGHPITDWVAIGPNETKCPDIFRGPLNVSWRPVLWETPLRLVKSSLNDFLFSLYQVTFFLCKVSAGTYFPLPPTPPTYNYFGPFFIFRNPGLMERIGGVMKWMVVCVFD